jgi:NitT/TauT family transport system substrate-binding protein
LLAPPLPITPRPIPRLLGRRTLLGTAAGFAALASLAACTPSGGSAPAAGSAPPAGAGAPGDAPAPAARGLETLDLAFCSQVLCILPFEVARQRGFFAAEGFDVNLVYMRGGTQAINALLSNSVDWVGTPIDLVIQTVAKGRQAIMVASTSQLPFFALAVSPRAPAVRAIKDLAGQKIGVGNLGTTDHLMALYLLQKEGVDPASVEFVALGPNLYEQLLRGQIEAGMVQEPSLTLTERAGGRVLVNFMRLEDTQRFLGGPYQFMGLNTRPDVLEKHPETARKLARALIRASRWILDNSGAATVRSAPEDLVAGGDVDLFANTVERYKRDLYPTDGKLVLDSVQRVIEVQQQSGALEAGQVVRPEQVYTNDYLPAEV